MGTRHWVWVVAAVVVLSVCPGLVRAKAYRLTVAGEGMEFVAQPERGYVVKVPERSGGLYSLAGLAALDTENARRVGGRDRRGVWTVENDGPAGRNEEMIRALRAGGHAAYAAPLFSCGGETVAVIPEIVIRVRPEVDTRQVHFLCKSLALAVIKPMEFTTQEYLLEVLGPDAEAVFAAVEQLNEVDVIEWACPNTAMRPKLAGQTTPNQVAWSGQPRSMTAGEETERTGVFPNDEYFPMQWHLYNTGQSGGTPGADIRAPEAWEITTGDPNIVIAILDSGVEFNHPDLADNLVSGWDFLDEDDLAEPAFHDIYNAHGTGCAGIMAAMGNNNIGVTGVAWDCKIMPVRIWGRRADEKYYWITGADMATAIRWAASHSADIIANSAYEGIASDIMRSAIAEVTRPGGLGRNGKGCVFMSLAGNDSAPLKSYPGKYPEVIAVGASDHNDMRCHYSNYGSELDIVAPSGWQMSDADFATSEGHGALWTTDLSGPEGWNADWDPNVLDYTSWSGTCGASSVGVGVAALILSIEPNLTGEEVRHFLERSAKDLGDPGRDDYYGWGRVNARAALDMVLAYRCDLNKDWKVDEQDLAILNAALDANDLSADIAPAAKRDGMVDANDLVLLAQYMGVEIPELGLLSHWRLDESEGDIAHDRINHRDGALHGGAIWQPEGGVVGGALQLDGVDAYVSTPFILNPYFAPFSATAWIKGGVPGQVILSQKNGANWLVADWVGRLVTELKAPASQSGQTLASNVVITDGNWHRIGLVREGTDRILYVDDVEVARDTQTSLVASISGFHIGGGKGLEPGTFFTGLIDDVRIYNRVVRP